MKSEEDEWVCPSFNSYSSNRLADIAAKVSCEFDGDADYSEESLLSNAVDDVKDHGNDNEDDEDFEFALVRNDLEVSGEEFFYDGEVRPVFPIFNRDLLENCDGKIEEADIGLMESGTIKVPLKKLFLEEREEREPPSSSSSEADELEAIPPGTYCVWEPKLVEPSPSSCKKSKSTGSGSKRWKIRDLLRRSNSDGKDSFVFLTPKRREEKSEKKISAGKSKAQAIASREKAAASASASPAHAALYASNRTVKGNETPRRKSYLPYRQDLVGFFTTANSLGRTIPRF